MTMNRRKMFALAGTAATSAVLQVAGGTAYAQENNSINLNIDGKNVTIENAPQKIKELNTFLENEDNFKQFAQDPDASLKKFNMTVDPDFIDQLKNRLNGKTSIKDLQSKVGQGGEDNATLWAVAAGSYSISSSKVAVAF
ncbi:MULTISPECIES: hypothetical protein [unclassified Mesorhizobium]|uniref:hypothetical protein n=1 Tax=unclassified Mesorhizobium TaxID=325217 RepID=UPI0033370DC4